MSSETGLAITDPEVAAFVRRTTVVEVATLSPKGRPFITPLWFMVDGGVVYLTTGPGSRAGRNVAHHPEVSLVFDGGAAGRGDRVFRLRGSATCHLGLPPWRALGRLALKYYLAPGALRTELANREKWPVRRLYYAKGEGPVGHIRVRPDSGEFLARP